MGGCTISGWVTVEATNANQIGKKITKTPRIIKPEAEEPEAPVGLAVLIPKKKSAPSKVLQQAEGTATKTGSAKFGVQTVDYDEEGNIVLSGRGVPDYRVLVYLDNDWLGETKVTREKTWTLTPESKIAPGSYTVRVDQIHPNGRVDARMEIPFTRDNTGRSELSKARTVIVLPGNNLWRIARVANGDLVGRRRGGRARVDRRPSNRRLSRW